MNHEIGRFLKRNKLLIVNPFIHLKNDLQKLKKENLSLSGRNQPFLYIRFSFIPSIFCMRLINDGCLAIFLWVFCGQSKA